MFIWFSLFLVSSYKTPAPFLPERNHPLSQLGRDANSVELKYLQSIRFFLNDTRGPQMFFKSSDKTK